MASSEEESKCWPYLRAEDVLGHIVFFGEEDNRVRPDHVSVLREADRRPLFGDDLYLSFLKMTCKNEIGELTPGYTQNEISFVKFHVFNSSSTRTKC